MLWLELKRKLFGIRHTAEFDVTNNCQMDCKHCYFHYFKPQQKYNEEDISIWEERLRALHKKGVRYVLLMGGEPSLRMDIIRLAAAIFPYVDVFTNGLIHIPRDIKVQVCLSLDGAEQTNDFIRGKGTYQKALANYENDPRVFVNMTLTKRNYTELEEVIRMTKEKGFRHVVCNIATYVGNPDYQDLAVGQQDWAEVVAHLDKMRKKHPGQLFFFDHMIKWLSQDGAIKNCYWKEQAYHYDAQWGRRDCFTPIGKSCRMCGCYTGALQSPLKVMWHLVKERIKTSLP